MPKPRLPTEGRTEVLSQEEIEQLLTPIYAGDTWKTVSARRKRLEKYLSSRFKTR